MKLEIKETPDTSEVAPGLMVTPAIDEDYWVFRVRLSDTQAILGFGKFGSIGIGFAVEEDWNTNLPSSCHTEDIFRHIKHNKGDDSISDDDVRAAIRLVQGAAAKYLGREVRTDENGDLMTATAGGSFMDRTGR